MDGDIENGPLLLASAQDIGAAVVFVASMVYLVAFQSIFGGSGASTTRDMERLKVE